ncbi:MAG: HEAT repeat domain-containing protein [Planctomycetes bacterium]|nr:HEAT repeat domain-containing protein [Planctomycetota bacterium]
MKKHLWIILLAALPTLATPARAQLFGRKPKVDPVQRVSELLVSVKTESDERKRAHAAEQLGSFDGKLFPEIVPVLAEVAQTDSKTSVRYDAVSSLAGIRPATPTARAALEKAAAADASWKVRWHAKTVLVKYRWAGPSTPEETKGPVFSEKTLTSVTPPPVQRPQATNVSNRNSTSPAPFPIATSKSDPPNLLPRPLPQGPTASPLQPQVAPAPAASDQGPELTPLPPPNRNPF